MCEVRFNSGSDEGKDVAALLATDLDDFQHRFHEAAARRALRPERQPTDPRTVATQQ
jgi:hypothetical protein